MWSRGSNTGYRSKEEWECTQLLANDRSIVIKNVKTVKDSCVVVWGCEVYITNAEKRLSDKDVCRDVNFIGKFLKDLAETSNDIFKIWKENGKEVK